MKARIIQTLHGEFITATVDADNLIAAMEVPDFAPGLFNSDDHRPRARMQDQPINGPMCDGDAIREECPEIYTSLSVWRSTSPGANAAHKHF